MRILRQILPVIVGAEAIYLTENARLRRHGQLIGRYSVDVAVDPAVDQMPVQSERRPSCARSGRPRIQEADIQIARSVRPPAGESTYSLRTKFPTARSASRTVDPLRPSSARCATACA